MPKRRGSRRTGWCRCPTGLTTRQAMAVGTAGLTAMLAVMALEDHGLTPDKGEVLVTGAAGGVGSVAIALLAQPRLPGRRRDRAARDGGLSARPRRGADRAARRSGRDGEAPAGGGDLGGLHRRRGRRDAGAGAGADEVRRLGRRGGAGGRRGAARLGDPVPAAGGEPAGHRFRDAALSATGSAPGPGSPATCRWTSWRR